MMMHGVVSSNLQVAVSVVELVVYDLLQQVFESALRQYGKYKTTWYCKGVRMRFERPCSFAKRNEIFHDDRELKDFGAL